MKKGIYRHYKGNLYEVIGIGKNSETLVDYVVYKPLYESKEFPGVEYWIRPINMFFEKVNIGGKDIDRFEYIGNSKYGNI